MKNSFFSFFAVFAILLVACNSKSEENSVTENSGKNFSNEIGRVVNGDFVITDLEAIRSQWETRLSKDKKITLKDFRIIKAYTIEEEPVKYYLLIGSTSNGKLKTASLLNLKDNSFYFDTRQDPDGSIIYSNIICEGSCVEGCLPIVNIYKGAKYLNCSPCVECLKKESEIR